MPRRKSPLYTVLPPDLLDRARDAAVALDRTLGSILTDGLRRELVCLERRNGGPFPSRGGRQLRRGRRKAPGKRAS